MDPRGVTRRDAAMHGARRGPMRRVRRIGRSLATWLALSVWPALPLLPMAGCLIAWTLGVL